MSRWLKMCFFALVVKPLVLVILGLNVRHRERLIQEGPSIIAANHNSHLDTLVLMSLFPLKALHRIRPVAASDYFMTNRLLTWFCTKVIGIIPIVRQQRSDAHTDPLAEVDAALTNGDTIIIFPEGTRGAPERIQTFKTGVAHLVKRHPAVPTVPVFLYGLGKALPRGEGLPVPFFCDVYVGSPVGWPGTRNEFMQRLKKISINWPRKRAMSPGSRFGLLAIANRLARILHQFTAENAKSDGGCAERACQFPGTTCKHCCFGPMSGVLFNSSHSVASVPLW